MTEWTIFEITERASLANGLQDAALSIQKRVREEASVRVPNGGYPSIRVLNREEVDGHLIATIEVLVAHKGSK